jgi:hypothetical protein
MFDPLYRGGGGELHSGDREGPNRSNVLREQVSIDKFAPVSLSLSLSDIHKHPFFCMKHAKRACAMFMCVTITRSFVAPRDACAHVACDIKLHKEMQRRENGKSMYSIAYTVHRLLIFIIYFARELRQNACNMYPCPHHSVTYQAATASKSKSKCGCC